MHLHKFIYLQTIATKIDFTMVDAAVFIKRLACTLDVSVSTIPGSQ